jgi:hypothetical protein
MTRMIGHGTAHPAALPLGPAFHLLRGGSFFNFNPFVMKIAKKPP